MRHRGGLVPSDDATDAGWWHEEESDNVCRVATASSIPPGDCKLLTEGSLRVNELVVASSWVTVIVLFCTSPSRLLKDDVVEKMVELIDAAGLLRPRLAGVPLILCLGLSLNKVLVGGDEDRDGGKRLGDDVGGKETAMSEDGGIAISFTTTTSTGG
jgi:hypothetical protein